MTNIFEQTQNTMDVDPLCCEDIFLEYLTEDFRTLSDSDVQRYAVPRASLVRMPEKNTYEVLVDVGIPFLSQDSQSAWLSSAMKQRWEVPADAPRSSLGNAHQRIGTERMRLLRLHSETTGTPVRVDAESATEALEKFEGAFSQNLRPGMLEVLEKQGRRWTVTQRRGAPSDEMISVDALALSFADLSEHRAKEFALPSLTLVRHAGSGYDVLGDVGVLYLLPKVQAASLSVLMKERWNLSSTSEAHWLNRPMYHETQQMRIALPHAKIPETSVPLRIPTNNADVAIDYLTRILSRRNLRFGKVTVFGLSGDDTRDHDEKRPITRSRNL
jgi:hypothetical protein